ncbi:TPA: fimbrial protein [Serratia marcescens]|nr:fimbrial protein [Serratia marcescens]HAV2137643.1 fimbrial protein [Serratia marcescens]
MRFKIAGLFLGMLPIFALADSAITVSVTIVAPPPCIINDDRPIEVEFGDVMTTRVDGDNYKMPVNYTLLCAKASSNAMKLQVQGNVASFDGKVLQTNKAGLGVQLLQGDSKLAVNSWLNFTYPNAPALWAVPVKQSGVTLTGGEFTAGATMKVAYQ